MFFPFYSPACFLYSSFPSLFLISSCVTLDLLYLPMHWPWILSSCLLWMMLLWAYAWLFSHALSELKLRSDFACSKGWGFSFLWGFHSHPPTEMVFLNDNDTPPPTMLKFVWFSFLWEYSPVKGSRVVLAMPTTPFQLLFFLGPRSSFPVPGVAFSFEFLYLYPILTLSSSFISNTWGLLLFLWV